MKINSKILSIPPHISTNWVNITSIQLVNEGGVNLLALILKDGHIIKIPNLAKEIIDQIFYCHSQYLEEENVDSSLKAPQMELGVDMQKAMAGMNIPLHFGTDGFQGMGALQHNPEQASSPNLPPEILGKITQVAQALGLNNDPDNLPIAEPHCNCVHCQIVRAMKGEDPKEVSDFQIEEEEDVSIDDLTFKEFDIDQKSDQLYEVTNPLDTTEHFQVFLGKPIGCTCGKKDCQHIKAVLNS